MLHPIELSSVNNFESSSHRFVFQLHLAYIYLVKIWPRTLFCYCFGIFSSYAQSTITTVAGNGIAGYSGDNGPALFAQLNAPVGIAVDLQGNIYFAEALNYSIRKVSLNDSITTIVGGTGSSAFNGDGIPATSANVCPINAVPDNAGNFFISDQCNSRIRKINAAGIISTIAGTGVAGYSGDNGPATQAQIKGPGLVILNRSGELVFTDFTAHCIRKIDTSGIISTIAGTGVAGFSGDNGSATTAQLNGPYAIAQDTAGNYYVADRLNNRIRKIFPNGVIITIAGTGLQGYSGDNGPAISATLNNPEQIAIDDTGNVFFADYYNHAIRKIDLSGTISTIAGTGIAGYSGDNGPATNAQLKYPWGVALDKYGDLYVADEYNHVIRKVTNVGVMSVKVPAKKVVAVRVWPNPNNGEFTVECPFPDGGIMTMYDITGTAVKTYSLNASEGSIKVRDEALAPGIYFYKIIAPNHALHTGRIVIIK